jgi:hypothetical protein
MKKIVYLIVLSIFSLITHAQSKQEMAVANAVEQLRMAMIDANKTKLENLVADKLSYGHSGGHIDDKKEFVEKLVSGKSEFVSIDLTVQTISISGKSAIVRHILKAKSNDGGKPGDVHLRVLLIWQKVNGRWVLLARQAVKMT